MAITQTFSSSQLQGISINNPTSIDWGPDGRLYISQQNGLIKAAEIEKVGDTWQVKSGTTIEQIDVVQDIPNHDDDGDLNTGVNNRQVTGIKVAGTANDPILYVTSSDPRIGAGGSGNDTNLDTNSGILSRLTWNGSSWDKVDLVIGLPRSEENHSTNGFDIRTEIVDGEAREIMYLAQGGHANAGAPSNNFAWTPEYYYSAAVLRVDLTQLEEMEANDGLSGGNNYVDPYVYALPTLDTDTNTLRQPGGTTNSTVDDEAGETFGGEDGFNQAIWDPDGPVQIYSPGYRNQYDVAITKNGNIYTFDNGPNGGWGGKPITYDGTIGTGSLTDGDGNPTVTNNPNKTGPGNSVQDKDQLHLVTEGFYAGHPNPFRASGNEAGLFKDGNAAQIPVPAGWGTIAPDLNGGAAGLNPQEGVYIGPGNNDSGGGLGPDGSLYTIGSSSNGLTEYSADGITDVIPETGKVVEVLAVASFNNKITLMEIQGDETQGGMIVTDSMEIPVNGNPLDITAVGNNGIPGVADTAGTMWVAHHGADNILILEPGTPVDPDTDQDNDGLEDNVDHLQYDPANGVNTVLSGGQSLFWDFNPGDEGLHPHPDGPYDIGMTGWQTNGTDFLDGLTDLENTIRGGAPGIFQVKQVGDGDTHEGNNTQKDAIQTGFMPAADVHDFTISVPILNPFSSNANATVSWGNYNAMGFSLGVGDMSNWIKFVVGSQNNGVYRMEIALEEDDSNVTSQSITAPQLASGPVDDDQILLSMKVDMTTFQATFFMDYQVNAVWQGQTAVGNPVQLPTGGKIVEALKGQYLNNGQLSAPVVTMVSTSFGSGGTPFVADFLEMTITANELPPQTFPDVQDQAELDGLTPTSAVDTIDYDGGGDIVLPDGFENVDLEDNANSSTITLNDDDNMVTAGPGEHTIDGQDGADTYKGTSANLDGDTFVNFGEDDQVIVQNKTVTIDNVAEGSAVVTLSDNSVITFDGNFDLGGFTATPSNGDTIITYTPTEVVLYRVNAGGGLVQATDGGPDWAANSGNGAQNGSGFSNNTGNHATFNDPVGRDASLPDYVPDAVFFTERWDVVSNPEMRYSFDVTPGQTYGVNIFARNGYSGTNDLGERVFDIRIEGQEIFSDVDLSGAYGHHTGGMLQRVVTVQDNSLDIEWIHQTENPLVNAIEIVQIGGSIYAPPNDSLFGTSIEISDNRLGPTDGGTLQLGDNTIVATQEGEGGDNNARDRDYFAFEVQQGQVLTGIVLDHYQNANSTLSDAFFAIQEGNQITVDPITGAPDGSEGLLGAVIYGFGSEDQDLLAEMATNGGPQPGYDLPTFETPLPAGIYSGWLNQGAGPSTATLRFVVTNVPDPGEVGAATLAINENSNNVQISNYGSNSFQITNVGTKDIAKVEIDVTNALYPDSVFDPYGIAGDTVSKQLTINTAGGTGVVTPDVGTQANPGTAYIGTGGISGYEGIQLFFDQGTNGGFDPGETLGFAVDMDPNSIAGATKATLDGGAVPSWDVGGISGAELIGSTFTVTFTDGTTATGQLQGKGNQGGSKGLATQDSPNTDVTLTVNGVAEGGVGTYGAGGPSVIVNGPAGATARVVLTKGIIQPVSNNFGEPYKTQLNNQLDALRAQDFPANNAAEFQTVDILLTGGDQDITGDFDFTQVPGFTLAVPENQVPLGFVASIIDPSNDNLPLGPVSDPIYLTFGTTQLPTVSIGVGSSTSEGDPAGFSLFLGPEFSSGFSQPITVRVQLLESDDSPAALGTPSNGGDLAFDETGATEIDVTIPATTEPPFNGPLILFDDSEVEDFETFDLQIVAANIGGAIDPNATQVPFDDTLARGGILDNEGITPVVEFVLINADTDEQVGSGSVGTIEEGEAIPLSVIEGLNLSMEVLVPAGSPFDGQVESVVFNFDNGLKTQTESFVPYALFGDAGGDFAAGLESLLSVGDHVISVALYAQNGGSGSPLATISRTFTVTDDSGGNGDPTAADDGGVGFISDEDTAFTTASVLANDSDPDTGDVLSVQGINTSGTIGQVINNNDGTFSYDPNGQFGSLNDGETATDSFVYTVSDGNGGTDTATVTVTINGVDGQSNNVAPTITSDGGGATASVNVAENTTFVTDVDAGDDNDSEVSGLTYGLSGTDSGLFSINAAGVLSFNNAPDFENPGDAGTDNAYNVTVTVTDSGGLGDSQDITVTVTDANEGATPVVEFVLINADTDEVVASVGTIEEGEAIPLSVIEGLNLSMEAIVPAGSPFDGQVESAVFNFDNGQKTQTESFVPYALFGDIGGDFKPGLEDLLSAGDHMIAVALHEQNGGSGASLATISRTFSVIDDLSVDPLNLQDGEIMLL